LLGSKSGTTSGKGAAKPKSKPKEYFDALVFAALVAFFLKIFFLEAYRIPTGSMENTLLVGDFLLVNKFVYGSTTPRNIPFTDIRVPYFRFPALKDPKRGDVVVFDFPGNRDDLQSPEVVNYIKRLIAEPGDTLHIINKVVYVNRQCFPHRLMEEANREYKTATLPTRGYSRKEAAGTKITTDLFGYR